MVAKFALGLSLVAPTLAGALGLNLRTFLSFDAVGSLLWTGFGVGLGLLAWEQAGYPVAQLTVDTATCSTVPAG